MGGDAIADPDQAADVARKLARDFAPTEGRATLQRKGATPRCCRPTRLLGPGG